MLRKLLENMLRNCFIYVSFNCVYVQVKEIPNLDIHKLAVTRILMACQNYMREKKVLENFLCYKDLCKFAG